MEKQKIIQKLKEKEETGSNVWIMFDLGDEMYDSLLGYIHEIRPNFVTLYTNEGRISVNYSQISKIH